MDQNTYIEQAAAHFRTLLTEQLNRQARMAQGSPAKDFSRMERIVIGLIPGDGIGPILMAQARRVLEKLLAARDCRRPGGAAGHRGADHRKPHGPGKGHS